jgi:hypothetical protein
MEKLKKSRHCNFDPVEAMFIFFILDDKYKKEIKHIPLQKTVGKS